MKLITLSESTLDQSSSKISTFFSQDKLNLIVEKTQLLNVKGSMSTIVNNVTLTETDAKPDLGLLVNKKLTWNENCQLPKRKALGALFQLKRSVKRMSLENQTKNAYNGYVPIATFCSKRLLLGFKNLQRANSLTPVSATNFVY